MCIRDRYQPDQPEQPDQPYQPDQPEQQTNYPYPYHSNQQQQDYQQQYNLESYMSYYTEDSGLNQLYAQLHVQQPFWFNTQKYQANKQQNQGYGENVYYMYQQALARYNLERMTNGLPPVTPITYNQPMQVNTGKSTTKTVIKLKDNQLLTRYKSFIITI